jgi:hypothetical protein
LWQGFGLENALSAAHIYGMTRYWQFWLVQATGYAVLAMSAALILWIILAVAN